MDVGQHWSRAGELARWAGKLLAFAEGARDVTFKADAQRAFEAVCAAIAAGDQGRLEAVAWELSRLLEGAAAVPRWATALSLVVAPGNDNTGPGKALKRAHLRAVTGANL